MTQTRLDDFIIHPPSGWHACNPSIAAAGDGFRMLVRLVNYAVTPDIRYVTHDGGGIVNHYLFLTLDRDFVVHSAIGLDLADATPPGRTWHSPDGYEDLRLTAHGDCWMALGASRSFNPNGRCEVYLLQIAALGLRRPIMVGTRRDGHEKNWMPAETPDGLRFVASCGDPTLVRLLSGRTLLRDAIVYAGPKEAERFRGGSQLLPFDDGWLGIVHDIALRRDGQRIYRHRWVWFDDHWRLREWSRAFSFRGEDFEFCAGLAPYGDDAVVASYGVWDRECWVEVFPTWGIRHALRSRGRNEAYA